MRVQGAANPTSRERRRRAPDGPPVPGKPKELILSEFDRLAGRMFDNYLNGDRSRRVSRDHLLQIASSLDKSEFLPPLEYLEPSCRDKLAAYNNKHARSAAGDGLRKPKIAP